MNYINEISWFGKNNPNNYPVDLEEKDLISGNVLKNFDAISELVIYGPQRTQFFLNDGYQPIWLGASNTFHIKSSNIYSIHFSPESIKQIGYEDSIIIRIKC